MSNGATDARLRRDALQITLQLPADSVEALIVLEYAEELVRGFLFGAPPRPPPPPPLRLV